VSLAARISVTIPALHERFAQRGNWSADGRPSQRIGAWRSRHDVRIATLCTLEMLSNLDGA
jgi:hypothetical protein